jgi:Mce-associated membrane protein
MTILDDTPGQEPAAASGDPSPRSDPMQAITTEGATSPEGGPSRQATSGVEVTTNGSGGTVTVPSPGRTPREWLGLHIVAIVVGLIVASLISALVLTTLQLRHRNAVDSARTSALAAAKTYAIELASYNYRTLDKNFGQVEADSTATFRKTFTQSSDLLKSVLAKYDARSSASVVAAGMVSASTSRAVALVFLNQTVSNTTQKSGSTTDQSRVEITLLHSGSRWLIDAVTLL